MVLFDKDFKFGWNQLIKSFKEVGEYTEDKNLVLLIEPGHKCETNLILTIEQCLSMIKVLKSEKFGILLDTGHANINGENLYEAILKCKGIPLRITSMIIKETLIHTWYQEQEILSLNL